MSQQPVLYEFPHSHFCEIARWALEHKGIEYQSVPLFPGVHAKKMKRLVAGTSVPVLQVGNTAVQGASRILDYLEDRHPEKSLNPDAPRAELDTLEKDLAARIGVPLRRLCYAYLLSEPKMVRYFFMHRSGWFQNMMFALMYSKMRNRIRDGYDCTPSGAESARRELTEAVEWIDGLLAGKDYFYGDRFSRADLYFASMLAFMVMPKQYPVDWPTELAEHELTGWFESFKDRRAYQQVATLYANHRAQGGLPSTKIP